MKRFLAFLPLILFGGMSSLSEDLIVLGHAFGPPKYYLEEDIPRGFIVDITVWCLEEMKIPHTISLYPWARAYNEAKAGRGAIIGLGKTTERLRLFDFSDPLYVGETMVITAVGKAFVFRTLPDLKDKRIGVPRGGSYGDAYDKAVKNKLFHLVEFTDPRHALRMLLAQRLDAVLLGPGEYGLQNVVDAEPALEIKDFTILPTPLFLSPKYLGIRKAPGNEDFLRRFNRALDKCRRTGIYEEIIDSYLSVSPE